MKSKPAIITLLVIFFPIGLLMMWNFGDWTKRTKWIVTGIITLIIALVFIGTYNSTPIITINSAQDGKISTDDTQYELTGDVSSMKAVALTINDESVPLSSDSKFSHKVSLEEGDNDFNLVATNDNGETGETVTIHRTTQAEFAARAEAEARKPRHTFDEFYKWVTAGSGHSGCGTGGECANWAYINSQCDYQGTYSDGEEGIFWDKSCLQDKYKEYLKPSGFDYGSTKDNVSTCPAEDSKYYSWVCSRFGDLLIYIKSVQQGDDESQRQEDKKKAETIYNEIAQTRGGN